MKSKLQKEFFLILILGLILLYFYGKNITKVCTVWEIPDETGYLANVAYFLGYDWKCIRGIIPYYGFGYSLILIFAFLLSNTGIQLIQIACIINLLSIIGIFLLLIKLYEKLELHESKLVIISVAFITCLHPYLGSNVYKVMCETFLAFWYILLVLIMLEALEKGKVYLYVLLGATTAFIYFIHTRALICCLSVFFVFICLIFFSGKKEIVVNFISMVSGFLLFFLILFAIKNGLLQSVGEIGKEIQNVGVSTQSTAHNLITKEYILTRIEWLFEDGNWKTYLMSFICKIFYAVMTSFVAIFFCINNLWKDIRESIRRENKEKWLNKIVIKSYMILSICFMVVAITLIGTARSDNYTYFFYGRYYEYMIIPIIGWGLLRILSGEMSNKQYVGSITVIIGLGVGVTKLENHLDSLKVHKDTNRIGMFSYAIDRNAEYTDMILFLILTYVFILAVYVWGRKSIWGKMLTCVLILNLSLVTTNINMDIVLHANEVAIKDSELASFLVKNDVEEVYFIDEVYKYSNFHTRMQVLLKDVEMEIKLPEDICEIEKNMYMITYITSNISNEELKHFNLVMQGNNFNLYQKVE